MKVLRIKVTGLPLMKQELDIQFTTLQKVSEMNKDKLFRLGNKIYLNPACAFTGINASGKTTVLKIIQLAFNILRNEPINHMESKNVLGGSSASVFKIWFCDEREQVCLLETKITSKKIKGGEYTYSIVDENLWEKPLSSVKTKKTLTEFAGLEPILRRTQKDEFLSDDVSMIIAKNKQNNNKLELCSLLSLTNMNVLPFSDEIPIEVIGFLDPTVERLHFEEEGGKVFIHLKFKDSEEILLNNAVDLEKYLSSGTIKGIVVFSMVKEILQSGGYILVDEIENHFNKEIVTTLIRFFMDSKLNKNGGILIFTTHYPEILDEYDRNDGIHIVKNRNGITVENLSTILKRNDINKSDAYQSGFLEGTTPNYESYMTLKKSLAASIE